MRAVFKFFTSELLEVTLRAATKATLTAAEATAGSTLAATTASEALATTLAVALLLRLEDAQELLGCEEGGELGAVLLLDIQTLL